ncbi:MAG: Ig-like domain-containing protein, partial [Thermoanaerobaculia bacterium]
TRFQATAAADGKFSFTITERVALSDTIDLQVVNAAGSVAAILPLTPFVTESGLGFVAPTDRAVTFHAANGVSVTTTAGTFDEPTVVTIADAPKVLFESVPNFATEINFVSGLAIMFDGAAKKPLEVEIPIPTGTVTDGRTFLLGRLGDSARGPRIEIDDTLRVADGKFTTAEVASGGNARVQTLETSDGRRVKDSLLRVVDGAARWAVIDLNTSGAPLAFAFAEGLATTLQLFFSSFNSLFCSDRYLLDTGGRAVFPVLAGVPFVLQGVDLGSGLDVFERKYDGVPLPPAGSVSPIGSPMPNESGPYPVFGNPFFVHVVDVDAPGVAFETVPGLTVEIPETSPASTLATIARTSAAPAQFGAINVTQSKLLPLGTVAPRSIDASVGNRLIVFGSAADVAPTGRLEIVFNEAIDYGRELANLAKLVRLDKREGSAWVRVPVDYEADSGDRRIAILLRGELQRGGEYRLTLDASIPDTAPAPNTKTLGFHVVLPFTVRRPHGKLTELTIPDGSVRDLALDGNLLFVAATDGDLLAYD